MFRRPPRSTRTYTLFPYTTLFRSHRDPRQAIWVVRGAGKPPLGRRGVAVAGAPHHLTQISRFVAIRIAKSTDFDIHRLFQLKPGLRDLVLGQFRGKIGQMHMIKRVRTDLVPGGGPLPYLRTRSEEQT